MLFKQCSSKKFTDEREEKNPFVDSFGMVCARSLPKFRPEISRRGSKRSSSRSLIGISRLVGSLCESGTARRTFLSAISISPQFALELTRSFIYLQDNIVPFMFSSKGKHVLALRVPLIDLRVLRKRTSSRISLTVSVHSLSHNRVREDFR